jgi:outer membrane protein TolC
MGVLMFSCGHKNRIYINTDKVSSLAIVFLSLALVACGSVPHPDLNVKTPSAWRNSAVSTSTSASNEAWWTALKDPVLNDAVELALKNNLNVAQSYERLNAERALEKATIASHKPRFGSYLGPNSSVAFANYRSSTAYLFGFDFIWEVPYTSKKEGERQIAKANVDMASAGMVAAKVSIIAEVVRVYGELRAADQKVQSLKKIVAYQQGIHEMFVRSVDVGAASPQEVAEVHSKLLEAESALSEMNAIRESALQRLDVLCGLDAPLAAWLNFNVSVWQVERAQIAPFAVPTDVIMQRPDIQSAAAAVAHAAGAVGVTEAELYPKLNIEGAIFYSGTLVRNGSTTKDGVLNFLSPSVRFPIWDWGMAREQKNASEAELRRSILSYRDAVLQAIAETEITIANFNAMDERIVRTANEAIDLEEAAKRNKVGLNKGYLSPLEAFRGQAKLQERKLVHADEQSAWLAAFAAANKAQTNMTIEKARMAEKPAAAVK